MKNNHSYTINEDEAATLMTIVDALQSISDSSDGEIPELDNAINSMYSLMACCYRDLNGADNNVSLFSEYEDDGRVPEAPDEDNDDGDHEDDDDDDGMVFDIENPQDVPDDVWEQLFNLIQNLGHGEEG